MTARDPEATAREIATCPCGITIGCGICGDHDVHYRIEKAIRDALEEGRKQGIEEADAALLEFAREAVQRQCGGHIRTALSDFADILRAIAAKEAPDAR